MEVSVGGRSAIVMRMLLDTGACQAVSSQAVVFLGRRPLHNGTMIHDRDECEASQPLSNRFR